MSKNTQISELINYISIDGSGNVVLSSGQLVATQNYVSTAISNLVASAPSTLDTLNELATALGNDPNFATTIATNIGTKQAQLNGTGFVKVTGTTVSYDNSNYLTSDSLTGYIPYTGATASVNIGTNDLTSRYLVAAGASALGGVISIRQDATYIPKGNGYSSIASSDVMFDFFGYTGASTYKNFTLRFDSLTNNTRREYTLPDVDGTLALTSNLNNYLPLVGGTLTGALSGTSATFSGSVIVGTTALLNFGPTSSFVGVSGNNSTGALQLYANNTQVLGFAASTSAATFSSSVTATSFTATASAIEIQGSVNAVKTLYINRYGVASGSQHRLRAENGYFEIASANSEPIVLAGGKVGIGITSPERILDIDATGSNAAIRLRKGSSNMIFLGTGSSSTSAGTENAILQMHHNGTERIRFYTEGNSWITGGNLGVGTASPSSKLTVSRDTESSAYQLELRNVGGISDGNYDGIRFTQGANGLTPLGSIRLKYKSSGYPDLGIFTRSGDSAETERLVILNGGNIGVNTPTPLEKLSVTGNLHVAGVGNGLLFDTDASGRSISQYVTNLYEFHILNARGNSSRFVLGNGSIWLGTSGTPQFYINTSSGNVGMGTTDFANLAFGSTLLKVAGTRATLGLQSSGTLSTIALISANNTATAMHLNYENTGAFRWYNYSSATETFTLLGNGRLGLGVSSPDAQLHVGGAILVSNNSQTYRRAITCHGQSGTYSQIKVYFNKSNWGSVTYDIKLASAGGTYHTAGCYYSNPGFSSNLVSINAGNGPSMSMTADSQTGSTQGALWVFSGATMIHPILTIDISCGNGYQVNPDDIVVQFL